MSWVLELAARGAGEDVSLLESKEWGNSTIHLLGRERPSVVIKAGKGWNADIVRRLHDDASRLADRFDRMNASTFVPRPLACSLDPPALCMQFVEGEDAWRIMKAEMSSPAPDAEKMQSLVALWARTLADYHRAERDGGDPEPELRKIAHRMGLSWTRARRIAGWENVSRAFHDVGLHNLRITRERRCALLDLPEETIYRPVHADVAAALAWLDDALRDAPYRKRRAIRASLVPVFLKTYASSGLMDLDREGDRWWLRFWEAYAQMSWARTALQRRHRFQLLETVVRAARNRARLSFPL